MALNNPSFETGWETLADKNQRPNGWELSYLPNGAQLKAPKAGNGDAVQVVNCRPECVHKLGAQLPPNEQLGGPNALILDGNAVYKIFGNSSFGASLHQELIVKAGSHCNLIVPVNVHGHLNPTTGIPYNVDTGAAYWRVMINGESSDWLTFNLNFDDRTWASYSRSFIALYGIVDILIECECHTLGGVSFFIDNLQFGTEEPQPTVCRGHPRLQYTRTYNLLPQDATLEQFKCVAELAYNERQTIGFSADDAAIGDLDIRNICVWWFTPQSWPSQQALTDFFNEWYPDISAIAHIHDYEVQPIPPPIMHYSQNYIGLQHADPKDGWKEYLQQAHPNAIKCFQLSQAVEAAHIEERVLSIWRKVISNDGNYLVGDLKANARKFLDLYSADLAAYSASQHMSIGEILEYIDVLESINETVPTFNPDHIKRAVEFDCHFSDLLDARYGGAVVAGLLTVAVGNPHETEVELLLPCAKLSHERGDFLSYHGYWSANRQKSYLLDNYPQHCGRWEEWDKIFNQHDYYPKYYLGECGICYAPDGWTFQSSQGWKSCGNFPNYIAQLELFNGEIERWNSLHQGRCYGGTVFIYGHSGWPDFDFNSGDLALLREAMKDYA